MKFSILISFLLYNTNVCFAQQLIKVTYVTGTEMVTQCVTPELFAKLPTTNVIESMPVLKQTARTSTPLKLGQVTYQATDGKMVQDPGFAAMWPDGVRVYVWEGLKTLKNVSDVFTDFEEIK